MEKDDDRTRRQLHSLAQDLQVIAMALATVERVDGARHADVLERAKRALERLDRAIQELTARRDP